MNIIHAFLLGIIEGLTEFIPVSSTAHMLIVQKLFNLPSDTAMFAFLILVQIGPLAALLIYFWKELWSLVKAFFARPFSTLENKLAWFIIIATIPALLAGVLLKKVVEELFQSPLFEAAIRLLAAAILLALAEWFGKRTRKLDSMTWLDALIVGLFQILAVFPGSSRSGSAISGGMLRNLDRASATRFAFLMSAPVMLAAGAYESLGMLKMHNLGAFLPLLAVGFVTAGIVGWLSIRWLINYISKHSLYIFAAYCAALGIIVLAASFLMA
jgi:undecaprenyl-diphosphatase